MSWPAINAPAPPACRRPARPFPRRRRGSCTGVPSVRDGGLFFFARWGVMCRWRAPRSGSAVEAYRPVPADSPSGGLFGASRGQLYPQKRPIVQERNRWCLICTSPPRVGKPGIRIVDKPPCASSVLGRCFSSPATYFDRGRSPLFRGPIRLVIGRGRDRSGRP